MSDLDKLEMYASGDVQKSANKTFDKGVIFMGHA